MARKLSLILSLFLIILAVFWSFYGSMPQEIPVSVPKNNFSTARAFQHVKALARKPHYVGSAAHNSVRNYIISELQQMDLLVQTQEGSSLNKYGILTHPQNILSRIEGSGNGKALLLLSHYDSAMHSSYGASDAGSGVATILEGIRAFLSSGKTPKNDIIILFTDAEELGLNGALLFMQEHPWAKDVGLALNFESRGSGGPSFMLLETNGGNKKLIEHFTKANPQFPVTNSLAYSVYKMLPNDTDLTVLREKGGIDGFNFAFIGDHFDYHTATDIPQNLDKNTLAHQGSYLMPLLDYFSDIPLENLNSTEDFIYFNFPVLNMVHYPFSFIFPMLFLAILLFVLILIFRFKKQHLKIKTVLMGFLPMLFSLFVSGILAFGLWKLCLFLYPQYQEMEHGFTYNGYYYIAAVIFLSLTVCFYSYSKFRGRKSLTGNFVAVLFLWILISALAVFYLKGASYFIIPVFFGLVQLFLLMKFKKPNPLLFSILSLPALFIILPFIVSFPVALGLKILFVAAILTALLWMLLLPVFGLFRGNKYFGFLCFLVFLVLFAIAHFKSDFTEERPKPNSLVYILDADTKSATWNTYDGILDSWTSPFFEEGSNTTAVNTIFSSKYNSGFTRSSRAKSIPLEPPFVSVEQLAPDSLGNRFYTIEIAPNREISRMDLFVDKKVNFTQFEVNGQKADSFSLGGKKLHIFKNRWSNRLLTYFPVNRDTLRINFSISKEQSPEMVLYGSSYNLFQNSALNVPPRDNVMIPRPFVLNDAIILKKTINLK